MKSKEIQVHKHSELGEVTINLPASKSISNRALIINRLAAGTYDIDNLSEARDTQTMLRLLKSTDEVLDVLDAGTTMRFLTAYLTSSNQKKILTGTERMCERPIRILVDALRELGGEIEYLKKDGYPPMQIKGLKDQKKNRISIQGDVSSQYISALLMIAPTLPEGLKLKLLGKVGSRPYINMTLNIMAHYGVKAQWQNDEITITPQQYKSAPFTVEPDWSGASYWYSFLALSKSGTVKIMGLKNESLQGDHAICDIMQSLGVETTFIQEGALLSKTNPLDNIKVDFSDCPDLAQTVAVVCAVKGITCQMSGLESLKIKETDRVWALQNELSKIGADLVEAEGIWTLVPSQKLPEAVYIDTYNDHRMAMAFAPLSTVMDVTIEDYSVVNKSFPSYWDEMDKVGFEIEG